MIKRGYNALHTKNLCLY